MVFVLLEISLNDKVEIRFSTQYSSSSRNFRNHFLNIVCTLQVSLLKGMAIFNNTIFKFINLIDNVLKRLTQKQFFLIQMDISF